MIDIFVYGPLADPVVRAALLGEARRASAATLADHSVQTSPDGEAAVLVSAPGDEAHGVLLVSPSDADAALVAAFGAGGAAWTDIHLDGAARTLRAGRGAGPWSRDMWRSTQRDFDIARATELALSGGAGIGIPRRAIGRLAAGTPAPAGLRTDPGPNAIRDLERERVAEGFFAYDVLTYRHRRYDGSLSDTIRREVFATGDAVTVLPWDPATDQVLLIEQVRAGTLARGEANPWSLEVIAGSLDRRETLEEAARREAEEEAGLALGRLVEIGAYYSSPGALTEHVTGFIGEATLARAGGVHGLASEGEDIRSLILSFAEAMAAVDRGEIRNAPALLSLYALNRQRAALATRWGYALAGRQGGD
ncbi:MAG: NUDIX domain-containing protein [Pseudomonadota bacterium]